MESSKPTALVSLTNYLSNLYDVKYPIIIPANKSINCSPPIIPNMNNNTHGYYLFLILHGKHNILTSFSGSLEDE